MKFLFVLISLIYLGECIGQKRVIEYSYLDVENISVPDANEVIIAELNIEVFNAGDITLSFDGNVFSSLPGRFTLDIYDEEDCCPVMGFDQYFIETHSEEHNSNAIIHRRNFSVLPGNHTFYLKIDYEGNNAYTGILSMYGSFLAEFIEDTDEDFINLDDYYHTELIGGLFEPEPFEKVDLGMIQHCGQGAGDLYIRATGQILDENNQFLLGFEDLVNEGEQDLLFFEDYELAVVQGSANENYHPFSLSRRYDDVSIANCGHRTLVGVPILDEEDAAFFSNALITSDFLAFDDGNFMIQEYVSSQFSLSQISELASISFESETSGVAVVTFDGNVTFNSSQDQLRFGVNTTDNSLGEGHQSVLVHRLDENASLANFSHTRIYELEPGEHYFYGLGELAEGSSGTGQSIVNGALTVKFLSQENFDLCNTQFWIIPVEGDNSTPPILSCELLEGYALANEACMNNTIEQFPFCETGWNQYSCQLTYIDCLFNGGCTDPMAYNYNEQVFLDNGTCKYSCQDCPGDLNGDFYVNVGDLGIFLGRFGENCAPQ